MADLTQEEWGTQLRNDPEAVILDIRTADEVEEGYIPNSIHLDFYIRQGFLDGLAELEKNKSYYVYCQSGSRSPQACAVMRNVGFIHTHSLLGGFNEWCGDVISDQ